MNALSKMRGALGQKKRPPTKAEGKRWMAAVAQMRCIICGFQPVEVHHCISDRYSQRRAFDTETIPLCFEHHRGMSGIHASKDAWEAQYGKDYEYLDAIQDAIEGSLTP